MKRVKTTILKLALVFLGFNAYGQTTTPPTGGGSDPNDIPIIQYINESDAYFSALDSQGVVIDSLSDYKSYKRLIEYYQNTTSFPNLSTTEIANEFNIWSKQNELDWKCTINNQYPYLNFSEVGPNQSSSGYPRGTGQIHYIEIDKSVPDNQKMYTCSNFGGLFVTVDGGQNWNNAGTDHNLPSLGVSSIALSINEPSTTWYITTGEGEAYDGLRKPGIGIWRTKNSGQTYERISISNPNLDEARRHRKIICLSGNNGKMRLVVASKNGLFYCEDGDLTSPVWIKIANGEFYDVEVQPNNQNIIYASGDVNTPLVRYDFNNDTPLNPTILSNMQMNFTIDTSNPNYLRTKEFRRVSIEFCQDIADKFVVMVTEKSDLNAIPTNTTMYICDVQDLSNVLLYEKGNLAGSSSDAGIGIERGMAWAVSPHLVNNEIKIVHGNISPLYMANFTFNNTQLTSSDWSIVSVGSDFHVDQHFMKFDVSSSNLYVGNDGGMYKVALNGVSSNLNKGLGVGAVYTLSTSQNGEREVLGSFQDMGQIIMDKNINNEWIPRTISGGDGNHDYINNINSNKLAMSNNYSSSLIYKNISGAYLGSSSMYPVPWEKNFDANSKDNDIIYSGTISGMRKHNYGITNSVLYSNLPIEASINESVGYKSQYIFDVFPSSNPKYSDVIYVIWSGGDLRRFDPDGNNGPLSKPPKIESRIYRSVVGGGTSTSNWELVETSVNYTTKIAVKYDNPNIFWYGDGAQLWKVDMTTGTEVKTLYSQGLPQIAFAGIKDICYVNGSDDALYVANKHGLYYTDNNHYNGIFQKVCSLPNAEITDIEIDYCRKKIVVATYGRGIWESDIDLPQTNPYLVENGSSITVTGDYYPGTDIIIEQNATLIVQGNLYMPQDSKITIKPGGNLRVDGGKITNACGGTWSGIEVLGDVNDITQSYSIQGHAYFYNDAVVENAQVAVRNFGTNAEGKKLWNTTGGIIQANNATFYNNRKSAEFIRYQRKNTSGALMNDRSYFRTTDFSWDDGLRDSPLNHITMYKTYGVRITACNFTDDRINAPSEWITNQNPSSCGIRTIDSKFYVQAKCNSTNLSNCVGDLTSNPTGWTPTTFKNLDFGIYASNASTENSILIDRSVFENNLYGIELVSSNSPTITRNHFNYSSAKDFITNANKYGIHAIRTLEFRIEQNKFENTNSGNSTVGIVCSDIGENNVDVYKNTFINLYYANMTQGKNRNYETPGIDNGRYGLQFLCNENINNSYDHLIKSTLWGANSHPKNGVKSINGYYDTQNNNSIGSGIEFTQNGQNNENYLNNSNNAITFYFEDPNIYPLREPIEFSNLNKIESNIAHTCPSHFVDKPIIKLPPIKKQELIADFNTTTTNLVTKTTEYSALVNGGDTDGLLVEISNLAPNNKHQLRQTLLSYSPYLTENVIRAVVDNHPSKYPHWWAFELVLENIEVAKSKEFMDFLANKQYPMPSWMRWTIQWFINNGAYTDNFNKQAELSALTYNKTFASDFILRDLKTDTVSTNLDSVEYWISQKNDVLVQTRLVDVNIQKGNYTQALSLLGSIKGSLNSMPSHLQAELNDFMAFKFKLIDIIQQDGGLGNMTDENHTFMTNTANSSTGLAQYQAQEILCFFYNECVDRPFGDDMTKSMVNETPPVEEMPDRELDFKMYPNPANDWVAIEFALSIEPITIMITDINGKLVMTETINKPMYIWETLSIPNGTYIINLINTQSEVVGTEKIIIQH